MWKYEFNAAIFWSDNSWNFETVHSAKLVICTCWYTSRNDDYTL